MSKIRITPRNNDNFENRKPKKEDISKTSNPVTSNTQEDIHFFLNKNVNDFTEETLKKFQLACQQYNQSFIENTKKINDKLFLLAQIVSFKNDTKATEKPTIENSSILSKLPIMFSELQLLIEEIVEDDTRENISFINTLIDGLIQVDKKLNHNEPMLDNVYDELTEVLLKLQPYTISQQKYIYRSIANSVNSVYTNYQLISPEDGSFADPKFHRVVSGNGQRIARGLSFILVDKHTDEVIRFGNIKTI